MDYLLIATLLVAVSMVLVAQFMMWLVQKMTSVTITQRFQDAEYILTHHQPPQSWTVPRSRFLRFMQGANESSFIMRLRHTLRPDIDETNTQEQFLVRLDDLIDFFETCPFFQDEGSRDIMMEKLWDERDRWAGEVRSNG